MTLKFDSSCIKPPKHKLTEVFEDVNNIVTRAIRNDTFIEPYEINIPYEFLKEVKEELTKRDFKVKVSNTDYFLNKILSFFSDGYTITIKLYKNNEKSN